MLSSFCLRLKKKNTFFFIFPFFYSSLRNWTEKIQTAQKRTQTVWTERQNAQKNDCLSASLTWKSFIEADSKLWILYSPAPSVDKSFRCVRSVKDETSVQTHTGSPGDCVHTGLGSSWLSHRLSFRFRLSAGCLRSLPVHANVQLQGTSWKTESRDRRGDGSSGCAERNLQDDAIRLFYSHLLLKPLKSGPRNWYFYIIKYILEPFSSPLPSVLFYSRQLFSVWYYKIWYVIMIYKPSAGVSISSFTAWASKDVGNRPNTL